MKRAIALAAIAAAAVSLWFVRDHTRGDTFSADEPVHILAGYLEVFGRTAIVNIEHPPLAKALAGLGLKTLPVPPPPARVPMGNRFTDYGHAFLFAGPVSPDRIAAAARAPFLGVLLFLLAAVFFAARSRYGAGAGLFALALLAFDPNFIAHAGVVHTDLGAALTYLLAVLAWDRARRDPLSVPAILLCAAALGLALATKFSSVYLLPIFLLQGLLGIRRDPRPGRAAARMLARFALAAAGAMLVVLAVYAPVTARMDPDEQRAVIHEMVGLRGAPNLSRAIEGLAGVSKPLAHYFGGLAAVARQNSVGGGVNYLLGETSTHGFPLYFFVAFFCKSTVAFVLVSALLLAGLARDPNLRREAALWLLPPGVLLLASAGSSYNIGIRHLLPAYPFLALAAAGVLARAAAAGRRRAAWLLCALPFVSAVETAAIHPHELSYFNPLVGGPAAGGRILSDSNIDWGLDLKRLAAELGRRGVRDATIAYFGGDDVLYRTGAADFVAAPAVRGRLVAISAFYVAAGPEYLRYHGAGEVAAALENLIGDLKARGSPAGRIGYSILLYELPPSGIIPGQRRSPA